MGLQISFGINHEVPVSGLGRGCAASNEGLAAGYSTEPGDDDLCRVCESESCAFADRDTAAHIGVASGAILRGKSSHKLLSEFVSLKKRYYCSLQADLSRSWVNGRCFCTPLSPTSRPPLIGAFEFPCQKVHESANSPRDEPSAGQNGVKWIGIRSPCRQ